ncbi:hypothetical protein D3C81_1097450 [compost metagenome]
MLLDLVVVLDVARGARGAIVATANLPGAGERVVANRVVAVAIAGVDNLVRVVFWLVVEHRATRARAAAVRVPVVVGVEAPVAVEGELVLERIRRDIGQCVGAGAPVDGRHLHLAVFEVQRLTDTDALTLEAVVLNPA